jgi:uncharacterized protein
MPANPPVKNIALTVSKTIGKVSATVQVPKKPIALLTLAHGAGAGKDHPFMVALSEALAGESISTIRFNFPFMENRKGRPDSPAVCADTIRAATTYAREKFKSVPLFVGGKSFGGRMSSSSLSKDCPEWVKGIVFYGFPLHPPGAPAIVRADHLTTIKLPLLFLQGTRDTLADQDLLKGVVKKLPGATLMLFEGADHSFKISKRQLMSELAGATHAWIEQLLSAPHDTAKK